MPLRDATSADFETLWQIDQRCFPPGIAYSKEELRGFMTQPDAFTLIASHNGATAGFLVINFEEVGRAGKSVIDRKTGHVITIDVLPEVRRTGIGSELLAVAERRLQDFRCQSLLLETAVNNESA